MADSASSGKRGSVSQSGDAAANVNVTPNRDASQNQKALNINAKSFVPRMEAAQLQEPGTPNRGAPQMMMPPPGLPNPLGVPVPPPGVMPFMPHMLPLMPPMMMVPPMMPPGFMPPPLRHPVPGMAGIPGAPGLPTTPVIPPPPPPTAAPGPASPAAAPPRIPMAPGFVTSPVVQPAAPLVSTPSNGNLPSPQVVSVGNATLAAKRSAVPPKFGCVLLAGITGVGKTTAGRQLVQELNEDKLGWQFFSGADFLKDSPNSKPTTWETTKAVFDGLNDFLDTTLARQSATPIRGVLIDKQLRGVEDLYYMTQLLRSKGLLLWGIIGMEVPSDEALLSRLGNAPGMIEKIKYHRVVYSRISEAAKQIGIWRTVDASVPKADACRMLRTMVLGCSSQSPTKQFTSHLYHDSSIPLVDNYNTYCSVMTTLFQCIPRNAKGVATFPGYVNYVPLPNAMLDVKKGALKEYAVRRKVDGVKYVLFYDGAKLYLIPRHMRCVFEMTQDAWLGVTLSNTGRFVVDGDLVKTTKDRTKEKFVVYDIVYWADKGSVANLVTRATWKERQERLSTNLCNEQTAFFPKKGDLVVVHQTIVDDSAKGITQLLSESCDYPTDGLIFHSTIVRKDDIVYMWRPPEAVTADFRLGAHTTQEDGTKVFALEVFDQKNAKYAQYRTDTTEIHGSKAASAVEGALVTCSLDTTATPLRWHFIRLRNDLTNPAYKHSVDELLKDCIIQKQVLLDYVAACEAKNPHGVSTTKQPQLGSEKQPAPPQPTAAPVQANAVVPGANLTNKGSRQVFGSALAGPEGMPPDFSQGAAAAASGPAAPTLRDIVAGDHRAKPTPAPKDELKTDAQKLSSIVGNVRVKPVEGIQSDVQVLQSIVGSVSVVTDESARASTHDRDRNKERGDGRRQDDNDAERCAACSADADGRVDRRDNKFYCFDCWAREGVDFCDECKDFASGRHDTTRRRGRQPFYCNACWRKYDRQSSREKKTEEKTDAPKPAEGEKADEKNPNSDDAKKDDKEAKARRRKAKPSTESPAAPNATESEQSPASAAEVAPPPPTQVPVEAS